MVRAGGRREPDVLLRWAPVAAAARTMKRLAVLLAALAVLALPAVAQAHPLGNFTVNRYAGIEIAGETVYLRYAVDLAEIPTFQIGADVRKPSYPTRLARDLELTIDGRRAPLRVLERRVTTTRGAAGLDTLRLDVVYVASGTGTTLSFRDRSFGGRIGWREITIVGPRRRRDHGVRRTRRERERACFARTRRSSFARRSTSRPHRPPSLPARARARRPRSTRQARRRESTRQGGFEALIEQGDLSTGVLLLSLLVAAFWGAAHALTPGHGKALVAAYLVGTRGKPRHAFLLGGTVTVAHTAGVFAIGARDARALPVHRPGAALSVAHAGLGLARGRRGRGSAPLADRGSKDSRHHGHTHHHRHPHGHDHTTGTATTTATWGRRGSSASASPRGCCRARRRSSCCSRRSRSIASGSGSP